MHRGGFAIYERQIFTHVGSSGSKRPQSARRLCPTESHRGVDGYLMEELTAGFRRVATRRQAHTAQSPAALSPARRLADDPELGRFHSGTGGQEPFRCQPPLEQLPHRRRPARHPPLESEIVKRNQLFGTQHDLQPLATLARHGSPPRTGVCVKLVSRSLLGKVWVGTKSSLSAIVASSQQDRNGEEA